MAAEKIARAKKRLSASISELLGSHRKSQVNVSDGDGLTSVHQAALIGNIQILRTLIQTGANVNVQDNKAMTPLHYAAWQSTPEVASLLLQNGARVDAFNHDGLTPLHVACQYGQNDLISLFLYYRADPLLRHSAHGPSPLDLACEYGRTRGVELLLDHIQRRQQNESTISNNNSSECHSLNVPPIGSLHSSMGHLILPSINCEDLKLAPKMQCSPLNLAAKNGHVDVMQILLNRAALDVNRSDPGSNGNMPLHEAAVHCRTDAVQFLLHAGADPAMTNIGGHTPLDLVKKNGARNDPVVQKVRSILTEASSALFGKAIEDFRGRNEKELTFNFGDIIWILDHTTDNSRWKGAIFGPKYTSRTGYFPANSVQLIEKKVGMQRSASQRQVKKVNVPLVPDIPGMHQQSIESNNSTSPVPPPPSMTSSAGHHRNYVQLSIGGIQPMAPNNHSGNNGTLSRNSSASSSATSQYGSLGATNTPSILMVHPMVNEQRKQQQQLEQQQMQMQQNYSSGTLRSQHSSTINGLSHHHPMHPQQQQQHSSHLAPNGNINATLSPARHRNSTGSNSSQASSGFESMKSAPSAQQTFVMNATVHQLRGDSPPSRNSVHSSGSSSLGSLERLDESGYGSSGHINVAEMVLNGVPDHEVLSAWLHGLHYEEYIPLFLNAGYDLPTVARMTPEDLTAIGITKPGHRKRLTTEIHRLNLIEQWPERKPASLREWLFVLKLPEYVPIFESQGINSPDQLTQLTWEDYEDFGVKKLGHLKKLVLASKKLKDYRQQAAAAAANRSDSSPMSHHQYQYDSNGATPTNGELLLINVPPNNCGSSSSSSMIGGNHSHSTNRNTAEVRPYSHVPPEMLSTFHGQQQGSPRHHQSSNNSPTHRLFLHHPSDQQHNFVVTTEAVVHDRPKVSVKPLLCSITTPPCGNGQFKRASREGLEKMDEFGKQQQQQHSPRHFQMSNCYASLLSGGGGSQGDVSGDYRFGNQRQAPSDSIMCRSAPPPMDSSPPPPPPPAPQKPPIGPLGRPGAVFQLSVNPLPKLLQQHHIVDETSSSFDELSPAPSMDEFPPPPSPILCVESIKNLRNVREHNPNTSSTALSMNSDDDEDHRRCTLNDSSTVATTSTGTLVKKRASLNQSTSASSGGGCTANGNRPSMESTSSTETLPFANENVGTIRQKCSETSGGGGIGSINGTPSRKPHVSDVFANGHQQTTMQRQGGTGSTTTTTTTNAHVLNDIGSMLQDLTDELDALLMEPRKDQQQHGVQPSISSS